jgi:hypothetical protein
VRFTKAPSLLGEGFGGGVNVTKAPSLLGEGVWGWGLIYYDFNPETNLMLNIGFVKHGFANLSYFYRINIKPMKYPY